MQEERLAVSLILYHSYTASAKHYLSTPKEKQVEREREREKARVFIDRSIK